jgi:hypothetical protein
MPGYEAERADFERYDAISASPAATESVHPPRAMTFEGWDIGRIVGRAGDRAFHKNVVRAALEVFTHDMPPGRVVVKQLSLRRPREKRGAAEFSRAPVSIGFILRRRTNEQK